MMLAQAVVVSNWFARDRRWYQHPSHAGRAHRVRSLFARELVRLDQTTSELPPRDVVVLKATHRTEHGIEQQAFIAGDKRLAEALSEEPLAQATWDLLTCGDVRISDVFALARARASGRLQ